MHADVTPYSAEIVKNNCSLPKAVDVRSLLQDRTTYLQQFFTTKSKEALCIAASQIQPTFWKIIYNNNWATERIGKLKGLVKNKIGENPIRLNRSDIRSRAYLCNMES